MASGSEGSGVVFGFSRLRSRRCCGPVLVFPRISNFAENNFLMDKKAKKRLEVIKKKLQGLRPRLAGAKQQADDPEEIRELESEVQKLESEAEALRAS